MSRTLLAPDAAHAFARPSGAGRFGILLKAWWAAYRRRRTERIMAETLRRMSDRQLRDIGIVRSEIDFAVRRGAERHRGAGFGL